MAFSWLFYGNAPCARYRFLSMAKGDKSRRDRRPAVPRSGGGRGKSSSKFSRGGREDGAERSFADFAQRSTRRPDVMRDVRRAASKDAGENKLSKLLRPSFGMLVVVLILAGTAFVAVAYNLRDVQARPVQNEDHWHSPYAVWDCVQGGEGGFLPAFQSDNDPSGIHSHGDGLIHVHPFYERSSGREAKLKHFMEAMGIAVTPESIVLDDGRVLTAGEECGGEPSIIVVARWEFASSVDEAPQVFTEGFGELRFLNNGEAWTIARTTEGAEIPPPPADRISFLQLVDPNALRRGDEEAGEGEEGNLEDAGE